MNLRSMPHSGFGTHLVGSFSHSDTSLSVDKDGIEPPHRGLQPRTLPSELFVHLSGGRFKLPLQASRTCSSSSWDTHPCVTPVSNKPPCVARIADPLATSCAPGKIRTCTLQILKLLPLPLGYERIVRPVGFEPTLSDFKSAASTELGYGRIGGSGWLVLPSLLLATIVAIISYPSAIQATLPKWKPYQLKLEYKQSEPDRKDNDRTATRRSTDLTPTSLTVRSIFITHFFPKSPTRINSQAKPHHAN